MGVSSMSETQNKCIDDENVALNHFHILGLVLEVMFTRILHLCIFENNMPLFASLAHVTVQTKECQILTLPCSCLMWATKTSLELKTLLQSLHVYPEPAGFFRSTEDLLFVFFRGEGGDFFSPFS